MENNLSYCADPDRIHYITQLSFCLTYLSQTVPVWPLLPVLLSAIRPEEPRGHAFERQTLQMWILWPRVRRGHHAQQPHSHAHRGEAVQVSKREYPHPSSHALLPAAPSSEPTSTYIQFPGNTSFLLTPSLLANNLFHLKWEDLKPAFQKFPVESWMCH